jgi:hypothetical protein
MAYESAPPALAINVNHRQMVKFRTVAVAAVLSEMASAAIKSCHQQGVERTDDNVETVQTVTLQAAEASTSPQQISPVSSGPQIPRSSSHVEEHAQLPSFDQLPLASHVNSPQPSPDAPIPTETPYVPRRRDLTQQVYTTGPQSQAIGRTGQVRTMMDLRGTSSLLKQEIRHRGPGTV